jgi:hypothetical protein
MVVPFWDLLIISVGFSLVLLGGLAYKTLEIKERKTVSNFMQISFLKLFKDYPFVIGLFFMGAFFVVGSLGNNWLQVIGSPAFGVVDLTICVIGIIIIMVTVVYLITLRYTSRR